MPEIGPEPFSESIDPRASSIPAAYATVDWSSLLAQIKQPGDDGPTEKLYWLFGRDVRYYLSRRLGPHDLEERVHDTFLILVAAIRSGDLCEPDGLMGCIKTVLRRQVARYSDYAVGSRQTAGIIVADTERSPGQEAIPRQRMEPPNNAMGKLSVQELEVLLRFYVHEQSQDQICQEMQITETQFRLKRSRAKAKFGDIETLASSRDFVVFAQAHPS